MNILNLFNKPTKQPTNIVTRNFTITEAYPLLSTTEYLNKIKQLVELGSGAWNYLTDGDGVHHINNTKGSKTELFISIAGLCTLALESLKTESLKTIN
jgi:hypothetical protein